MKNVLALMLLGLLLSGCGTIRTHRTVLQPMGSPLTASVGSSLFRLNKQRDLPNMWGGRDIYGGKVGKGCVGALNSPGTSDCGTGRSSTG